MARFFFTYGTHHGFPYRGGWSEVCAKNRHDAVAIFRLYHPDRTEGIVNCADIYDEDNFSRTTMPESGNLGARCHEEISVTCIRF